MMNEKTKYEIYRQMFNKAQELRIEIERHLIHVYPIVYSVFVAVGDEEKGLYFVDVEVGGGSNSGKYERFRGMFTEEQILKKFC
jgi:hypothetical protein